MDFSLPGRDKEADLKPKNQKEGEDSVKLTQKIGFNIMCQVGYTLFRQLLPCHSL